MRAPKLSILLTTYDRLSCLQRTFPTLLDQDCPPEQYEIVVVVDGSTDGSAKFLRSLPARCAVRIIEQPNAGQVAAQNVGLQAAKGEIILLMDDEVIATRSLVREHLAGHAGGGPLAVFGPVKIDAGSLDTIASHWTAAWFKNYEEDEHGLRGRADYLSMPMASPNNSIPRAALLASGGFDERFGFTQDLEVGMRLRALGVRAHFQPGALAYQISVKTDTDLVHKDAVRQAREYVGLARRHPDWSRNLPLASVVTGGMLKRALLRLSAARPMAVESLLRLPYGMMERLRSVPAARRAGLRLLDYRRLVMMMHGAQAGSWSALQALFARAEAGQST